MTEQPQTKALQKWADKAMYSAAPIDATEGPQVQLLSCNADPLGTIASAALMYEGKHVASLAEITDDQRRYYLEQVQRSVLEAPLEFVNFHFHISGVTRGFTHQMVRQRTATYTQESTRFAVKESVPVGYPPSLDGTVPWKEWWRKCYLELYPNKAGDVPEWTVPPRSVLPNYVLYDVDEYAAKSATPQQLWRKEWDECVDDIEQRYNLLVNTGMPAEDARGLLPTNLLTRINYNTSLRGLKDHAGVRLCTQAQFEWRVVWTRMLEAIREYGKNQLYYRPATAEEAECEREFDDPRRHFCVSSAWQFDALASIFKPICYYKGKCQFMSDVDRHCTIRDRVEAFAKHGVPSKHWDGDYPIWPKHAPEFDSSVNPEIVLEGIRDEEWMLDTASARIAQ